MSDPAPQLGLSREKLLSIQKALRESCEAYSAKEKANTLTRADYDSWQDCIYAPSTAVTSDDREAFQTSKKKIQLVECRVATLRYSEDFAPDHINLGALQNHATRWNNFDQRGLASSSKLPAHSPCAG